MVSTKQRWLFGIIALLIPVVTLCSLEALLRVAGYGKSLPLFIENPSHPAYRLPRPDILTRYFPADRAPRVTMEANFFLAEKPDNALRLFVQGGSTAAGFPYGLGASPAAMLETRLRQSFPHRHVEVVNTAMSAVNSYLLAELAEEIIAQQPDGVLIYAGHNEYLGILGAGSAFSIGGQWLTRAYLSVAHLAITDALQQLLPGLPDEATASSRTFMSQIAKDTAIEIDSKRYWQGLTQFDSNLTRLITAYREAGIPVFLSTIASNVGDQPPFASSVTPGNARELYQQAQIALDEGRTQRARDLFEQARDNDLLRFRAPSAINTRIRQHAAQSGVTLVDSHAALASRSRHQIIGDSLMLEHLHPNLPGYFIIADTFYQSLITHFADQNSLSVATDQAWRQRPITKAEEYYGYAQVQALKADFPFTPEPRPVALSAPGDWAQALGKAYFEKQLNWRDMMQRLYNGYTQRDDQINSMKTLKLLADALPHHALYNEQAGDRSYQHQHYANALFYYQRAVRAGAISPHLNTRIPLLKQRLDRQ